MELIIYSPKHGEFLQKIEWNFEELKEEITRKTQDYVNLVYTDDQIKEAKGDRARLNNLINAMENERKEIKKEMLAPYNAFEKQEKELKEIVLTAVKSIDVQIKAYEQKKRDEKLEKVKEIYAECIKDLDRIVPFEKAFKESYLNVGTTLKSIRAEMNELYEKTDRELKLIIADMSPYVISMKKVYEETLDFALAMQKKNELEEADRLRKKAEEARKAQEESRKAELAKDVREIAPVKPDALEPVSEPTPEPHAEPVGRKRIRRITFQITAEESQFDYLNKALKEISKHCMEFKPIDKEDL